MTGPRGPGGPNPREFTVGFPPRPPILGPPSPPQASQNWLFWVKKKRQIQENRKFSNFYIFDHFWNNFCVENGPVPLQRGPLQRGPLPQGSLQRGPWKPKDRRQDNCRNSALPDFWGKNNRKKLLKLRPCFCVLRVPVFVCAPRHAVPGSQNPAQAIQHMYGY